MNQQKIATGIIGVAVLIALLVIVHIYHPSSASAALREQLLAVQNSIPTEAGKNDFLKQSHNLAQKVDPELVDLDSQIITCDANVDGIASGNGTFNGSCIAPNGGTAQNVAGKYMGGQCCSALMDTKNYHENLQKLQAYKSMPDIPLDPMHTPIDMAKRWIDYDKNTTLMPDEQKIYDAAYAMSEEKPCCCKCWHYFVNEGIAKKMIKTGAFNSKQIADYWDSSDICGS